jgi:hypothetical protein
MPPEFISSRKYRLVALNRIKILSQQTTVLCQEGLPHCSMGVLATCGIRSSKRTSKNVFQCIQPLADEPEEEENQQTLTSHLHNKKETSTVNGILISIKRLTSNCFQALNPHFLNWTKPATSSLILGTLTDLARRKSELMAENALLRQQLIILRRQVKRPACTRADRMLLMLLARIVRTWKHALFIVQPETL